MLEQRLEHQVLTIKRLIEEYRAGLIVIPEFQREYVWKPNKAPYLIDSLYRGYPISSLLLWVSTENTKARRRDPKPSRAAYASWLIDGQQRLITLSRCMSGEEGIDIVFSPDEEVFRLANATTKRDPRWFRLSELWDEDSYRRIRRDLQGHDGERREAKFDKAREILKYEVPAVKMVDHSFQDAVAAFRRINTLGMKLKKEDIESAQVAAKHSGFIADDVVPFLSEVRREGYSRMNVMHLFRACAFVAKPDGRDRTPLHELDRTEVQFAWNTTKRATKSAIGLIRSELGLISMDILWSGSFLVPLIALCATKGPRERDAKEMIGWLALAAIHHRYSGASETALDQDLRACRSEDAIGALLSNLRKSAPKLRASPSHFNGSLVDKGGLLAAYIACRQQGILDLFGGGKVILQAQVDRHHILPRTQFSEARKASADCVANIAFVSGDANRNVSNKGPEVYLKTIPAAVLRSQCIPTDKSLWLVEAAGEFWDARKALLAKSFNQFLDETLPNRKI